MKKLCLKIFFLSLSLFILSVGNFFHCSLFILVSSVSAGTENMAEWLAPADGPGPINNFLPKQTQDSMRQKFIQENQNHQITCNGQIITVYQIDSLPEKEKQLCFSKVSLFNASGDEKTKRVVEKLDNFVFWPKNSQVQETSDKVLGIFDDLWELIAGERNQGFVQRKKPLFTPLIRYCPSVQDSRYFSNLPPECKGTAENTDQTRGAQTVLGEALAANAPTPAQAPAAQNRELGVKTACRFLLDTIWPKNLTKPSYCQ